MAHKTFNGKRTLPLNGWRTRILAEYLFGSREKEDKFEEDFRFIVPAKVLQDLPEFDGGNQEYADSFSGDVVCVVEFVDRSYGIHISVEPALDIRAMNFDVPWGRWADCIKAEVIEGRYENWVTLYWKCVRPEDKIMRFEASAIPNAEKLQHLQTLTQGYWCDNDLVFKAIQLHGAELQRKIEQACVL